jgi:hypothetical protein
VVFLYFLIGSCEGVTGWCKTYSAIGSIIDAIESLEESHSVDEGHAIGRPITHLFGTRQRLTPPQPKPDEELTSPIIRYRLSFVPWITVLSDRGHSCAFGVREKTSLPILKSRLLRFLY